MTVGATARFTAGLSQVSLAAGDKIIRIHHQDHGAIFFGPVHGGLPQNRFDAPAGQYRVMYSAQQLQGAFVETILRQPGRRLRRAFINERVWSEIEVMRPLSLAKLYDEGLQIHRVDAGDISIDDYATSRSLTLALHEDFPDIDGLAYRSRYNNGEICFAFFDRVSPSDLHTLKTRRFDAETALVDQLMKVHGAQLDTSSTP